MERKLKLYISSTFLDMEHTRAKIIERIHKGLSPHFELTEIMEKMSGDPANRTNVDICRAEVRKADLYILLTGKRYGSYPETYLSKAGKQVINTEKKSYTELEYEAACETLNDKFYGIYKLELTDAYFADAGLTDYSDLDNEDRKQSYERFLKKLNETVSAIKINSAALLQQTVNDKLGEFFMRCNTKEKLDITYFEKVSIDRKLQVEKIRTFADDYEIEAGTFTFLVDVENESDGYEEFTARLSEVLTRKEPEKKLGVIHSSSLSSLINAAPDKQMKILLMESAMSIYNDLPRGLTFEKLAADLKSIRNVFICFTVDAITDTSTSLGFTEAISRFVKKTEELLAQGGFAFNFFFFVYFYSDQNKNMGAEHVTHFKDLQHHYVGRLPNVNLDDIKEWTEQIKQKRPIEEDTDSLMKLIFTDTSIFPAKYKKCLTIIDKRTK
jgi:Domain of unknown function (DUF4062)